MKIRFSPAGIALTYAASAAVWIVASDSLVNLVAVDAAMQGRIEIAKGLGFVAATSLLLFLLLRFNMAGASSSTFNDGAHSGEMRRLAGLLFILALTVPLIGFAVFALHARQDEHDVLDDLRVIANTKTEQIQNWLGERRGDAIVLASSRGFIERVSALQQTGNARERAFVLDRLQTLQKTSFYDSIVLLDPQGSVLFSVGESAEVPSSLKALASTALADGVIQMADFHEGTQGHLHLGFIAPLRAGADGLTPVGAVLLQINPEIFLYPLIQTWPAASKSGEMLLARRNAESVLYLNRLRHSDVAPLTLKHDVNDPALPAAVAIQKGGSGSLRGKDYRGVSVLAAYHDVTGTDWHLIAKLDRSEALEAAWTIALWVSAVALLAAALVAVAALLLVRQNRVAQDLALRLQAHGLVKQFYDLPFVGMAVTSAATKRWVNFNDRLCEIFGYTREELAEKTWTEMSHPEDLDKDLAEFEKVLGGKSEGYVMEKRFYRKDGTILFAQIDVKCVRAADGTVDYFVATVDDISGRKAAEQALVISENQFRAIVEQSIAGFYVLHGTEILYMNPRSAEILGYERPEDLIGRDVLSLIVEADRGPIAELIRQLVSGETATANYALAAIRKDGSIVEIGATANASSFQGKPAIVGLMQDISEKKRAEEEAKRYLAQLQNALMHTVEVATTLSEMRDPYTTGHEKRVAQIAVAIAGVLGFNAHRIEGLQIAGYLHDIGKITIPSEILSKPGRLSTAEYELVKGHAQASYDVLKNVEFPWRIAEMVWQHHERIDGSGYPRGLLGVAMLPEAKILAVADVVEAMASHRPYRPGLGIKAALEEIERGSGSIYDPDIAAACLRLFRENAFSLPV